MRILYLDLDTLRPDHLGCYGYHRNTSPNIDRIASEGVRFDNYYCADAPCLPSRTSLITGQFGIHHGVINHGGVCADPRPEGGTRSFQQQLERGSLWGTIRRGGMRTVSISPFAPRHSAWQFNAGFDEMYNTGQYGSESAEYITPTVLDWIERNGESDNWFMQVNYWDPHTAYRAPEEFGNPFETDPLPSFYTEEKVEVFKNTVGGHGPWEIGMFGDGTIPGLPRQPGTTIDMAGVRKMVDGYDCGIRYMDDHIGMLFDALEKKGVLDDLVVIISSDHGENLGELGCCAEHGTADNITCRIPMIVRWPGKAKAGHVDTGLHYNLDLAPTMAEMLEVDPAFFWDGESFASTLTDGADTGRPYIVVSQCCHGAQRSVRWGDWIYIRTYHDFYHLYPKEMLFNLVEDPHEEHNLAQERPDLCKEATYMYMQWHDEMMAGSQSDADPLWTVIREGGPFHSRGQLSTYCERLEETGRGWAVDELKRRHPQEFAG